MFSVRKGGEINEFVDFGNWIRAVTVTLSFQLIKKEKDICSELKMELN